LFTGIIENTAQIVEIRANQGNLTFSLTCPFVNELKVDQSVAHNGVCLTVTEIDLDANLYRVTAIEETLQRTNLDKLQIHDLVNIERCLKISSLLDGHLVQGHVDTTAVCTQRIDLDGSWKYYFEYINSHKQGFITVEKGSVTVNGVSLTVVDSNTSSFSVAIIPYTFEHTNFKNIHVGDRVNIEFDIIGKYIAKLLAKTDRL
jgi:riboflavin synthase